MGSDPRRAAWRAIERSSRGAGAGPPLEAVLSFEARGLSESDRALCRELALGTVRWRRRLDHVIEAASGRRSKQIDRRLRTVLRLGAYQLLFLDRIPAYAAVNESVSQARGHAGAAAAGFVNRALRRIAERPELGRWPVEVRDPATRLGIETSHPDLLVRRWLDRWGEDETRRLLDANNAPRPMQLLAFEDRGGRERLAADLALEAVETEPARLSPLGLVVRSGSPMKSAAFERGDFYVQDQISQVATWMPPPREGERIFDACAAPGGKSFALLAAEPAARIVAADRLASRVQRLVENQHRLGRQFPLVLAEAERPPFAKSGFDRVFLDLPCSGTGTLRQHPELKWRITEREIERLAAQGLELVVEAANLVRPGGLLVVATCTLEPEENESMIDAFLATDSRYGLLDLEGSVPSAVAHGLFGRGRWRLPTEADHDGFTVHVLERR